MNTLAPFVEYLADTPVRSARHYGRSLLEHLCDTAATLDRWGYDHELQLAGLFHSFYAAVAQPTVRSRALVARAIGEGAERLVFAYTTGEPAAPSDALRCLEAANAYDLRMHVARSDHERAVLARYLEARRPLLTPFGAAEVLAVMGCVTS